MKNKKNEKKSVTISLREITLNRIKRSTHALSKLGEQFYSGLSESKISELNKKEQFVKTAVYLSKEAIKNKKKLNNSSRALNNHIEHQMKLWSIKDE